MQHKDRLSDEERKARRLESARKYREANREKTRESSRLSQAKRRESPEARERDKLYKQDPGYRERQRRYRYENRERLTAKIMEWRQANLDRYLSYQRSYHQENRVAVRQRLARWRLANPDRSKAQSRKWRQEKPDQNRLKSLRYRARKLLAAGNLSRSIVLRLMASQRGKCACCRSALGNTGYHLDHIMPLALGGANSDLNVQLLCPQCNLSKRAKHPIDFMQERGFLL